MTTGTWFIRQNFSSIISKELGDFIDRNRSYSKLFEYEFIIHQSPYLGKDGWNRVFRILIDYFFTLKKSSI